MSVDNQATPIIRGGNLGATIPFDSLTDPGTYICTWSGHLLRVPEDALKLGRSPVMSIKSTEPLYVAKVSHDPFIPVTKARLLAADGDFPVAF